MLIGADRLNMLNCTDVMNKKKTLVMGILNVTPDSFSDGGKFNRIDTAINHVDEMIAAGADIIDIGAESTRPNAEKISAEEEISRLEPIFKIIADKCPVPISIDTYKPKVAEFAINLGAEIINDIDGLSSDMAKIAAKYDKKIIVTHNQITDENIIDNIKKFFRQSLKIADEVGLNRRNIIFDSGIGFNKTQEQNLQILRSLEQLKIVDGVEYPMMLGVSRKSVIGYAVNLPIDERDEATGALCVIGISKGINIVRVHNVEMISRMCKIIDAVYSFPSPKF